MISNKQFEKKVLDENVETFVIYVAFISITYLAKKPQIASFFMKNVQILNKYLDYAFIFLEEKTALLEEFTNLNQYTINLQKS